MRAFDMAYIGTMDSLAKQWSEIGNKSTKTSLYDLNFHFEEWMASITHMPIVKSIVELILKWDKNDENHPLKLERMRTYSMESRDTYFAKNVAVLTEEAERVRSEYDYTDDELREAERDEIEANEAALNASTSAAASVAARHSKSSAKPKASGTGRRRARPSRSKPKPPDAVSSESLAKH